MVRRWGWAVVVVWLCGLMGVELAAAEEAVSSAHDAEPASVSNDQAAPQAQAATQNEPTESPGPKRLSMDFEGAKLMDVLKTFSQETGINVIASAGVREQPVSLYLEDVTAMDAFDQILNASNLTYERPAGSDIYIVKPKGEEATATITRVYRLKYARVSSSLLAKAAAAFGARTPFEATLEAKSGGTTTSSGSQAKDIGIDQVLTNLLTEKGEIVVDARTNSLVITDVPENFPRLEAALVALDVRTAQIMVDAEVIETALGKTKSLGFKWGDSNGQVFQLTPAKIQTKFPFTQTFGLDRFDSTASKPTFTVGTFDTSQATAALNMLENDTDSKILARPKVLTLDNESAVIRLTTKEAIGFTTSSQTQTGTNTSAPERETTGIVLVVTPQVNEQGYITMLVEPSVTKTVVSKLGAPTGGVNPKDPKTRSSRTLVRIRSGDTLVVGGLIDRSDETTLRKVPVLSGIPVLGEAFKNSGVDKGESELIVFITPKILDEPTTAPQLASAGQSAPMGLREQEPSGARQETIEQTLNQLEQPAH